MGFVLLYNHQCSSGSSGCGYCSKGKSSGQIEGLMISEQRNNYKYDVNTDHRSHCLHNTDHHSLSASSPQLRELEFVSYRECYEAQGNGGYYLHTLDILKGVEPQSGKSKSSKAIWPHQHTGYQKCRDIREIKVHDLEQTGHHQPGKHGNCQRKKFCRHLCS